MLSAAVVVCQDVCLVDNVRTCSVRDMYKDIINMMLKRNGEPEDPIGVNEVYFLLAGPAHEALSGNTHGQTVLSLP